MQQCEMYTVNYNTPNNKNVSFNNTFNAVLHPPLFVCFTHSYAVTACTSEGCVTSPPAHATTLEAPPAAVVPPAVGRVTAHSLTASWDAPPGHGGRVTEYALRLDGRDAYRGPALSSVVSELRPHTSYQLALLACTSGGCTSSAAVTIVTGEAPPTGLQPPTVKVRRLTFARAHLFTGLEKDTENRGSLKLPNVFVIPNGA